MGGERQRGYRPRRIFILLARALQPPRNNRSRNCLLSVFRGRASRQALLQSASIITLAERKRERCFDQLITLRIGHLSPASGLSRAPRPKSRAPPTPELLHRPLLYNCEVFRQGSPQAASGDPGPTSTFHFWLRAQASSLHFFEFVNSFLLPLIKTARAPDVRARAASLKFRLMTTSDECCCCCRQSVGNTGLNKFLRAGGSRKNSD